MSSSDKGGKGMLSSWSWLVIWGGIAIVSLALGALFSKLPEVLALFSGTIGSAMLCTAAVLDCTQKGKRRGKAVGYFKWWVAIGAILVYVGAWGLLFVRLEEIFKTTFPL